jgi:uncharacterized protein
MGRDLFRGIHAADAQSGVVQRHDNEPGPRRNFRHAAAAGAIRSGRAGPGDQYVSWIHDEDFARAVEFLMAHEEFHGAVNLAAPEPLPSRDFMRTLREAWGTKVGLPASKWMLETGAILLRTETELILKSRRVIPGRLLSAGFEFHFPQWCAAAENLVRRWKGSKTSSCATGKPYPGPPA